MRARTLCQALIVLAVLCTVALAVNGCPARPDAQRAETAPTANQAAAPFAGGLPANAEVRPGPAKEPDHTVVPEAVNAPPQKPEGTNQAPPAPSRVVPPASPAQPSGKATPPPPAPKASQRPPASQPPATGGAAKQPPTSTEAKRPGPGQGKGARGAFWGGEPVPLTGELAKIADKRKQLTSYKTTTATGDRTMGAVYVKQQGGKPVMVKTERGDGGWTLLRLDKGDMYRYDPQTQVITHMQGGSRDLVRWRANQHTFGDLQALASAPTPPKITSAKLGNLDCWRIEVAGPQFTMVTWIDKQYGLPRQSQYGDRTVTHRVEQVNAVPDSVFALPQGVKVVERKWEPGAGMGKGGGRGRREGPPGARAGMGAPGAGPGNRGMPEGPPGGSPAAQGGAEKAGAAPEPPE